ncbi:hypothetical protein EHS25_009424 [Saitozyma podzolica]|uniref:SAM domain-containing protein n=1 Tax=Saitozyma podzolica TaxID=1890683 RepID=A0A427YLU6_9TREE|nr:hypothetical protein EHS25_009424 [Saitozyma podzolica]
MSVLQHMAQSDPMTALLSPNPAQSSLQTQMEAKLASMNLKSPSAGGASGFPGSPTVNQFLAPEAASTSTGANQSKLRQNRISAPGTLQPSDRWQGQLDQVIERGPSPGVESNTSSRSRSPAPEPRPKSTDFAGKSRESDTGFARSPRLSGGLGLGLGQTEASSPASSPYLNNASWASMSNTPLVPMFTDPKIDVGMSSALNMANLQLAAAVGNPTSRVALDDVRQYRRAGATSGATGRNVSGQYNDDGELVNSQAYQPGRSASPLTSSPFNGQSWSRSPVMDQFGLGGLGLGDTNALAGLGMNFSNNLNPLVNPNAAQMLALAQAQQQQLATAASFAQAGYGGQPGSQLNLPRASGRPSTGRRSPLLGKSHSPSPAGDRGAAAGGGGAGGGAGVAGPDDIDLKILEDVSSWLRVLRLHKYTANFEKSNWKQMALMTDADLQDNGVNAQGARTKFLKVFYNVRIKFDIPHPEGQEEYAPGATKEGDK